VPDDQNKWSKLATFYYNSVITATYALILNYSFKQILKQLTNSNFLKLKLLQCYIKTNFISLSTL